MLAQRWARIDDGTLLKRQTKGFVMKYWAIPIDGLSGNFGDLLGAFHQDCSEQELAWATQQAKQGDLVVHLDMETRMVTGFNRFRRALVRTRYEGWRELLFEFFNFYDLDDPVPLDNADEQELLVQMDDSAGQQIWPISQRAFDKLVRYLTKHGAVDETDFHERMRAGHEMVDESSPSELADVPTDSRARKRSVEVVAKHVRQIETELANKPGLYGKRRVTAMIRNDQTLIRTLKKLYRFRCQWPGCDANIPTKSGGLYCEVAHITPVSEGGGATRLNLLVLCPNHHKTLDLGDVAVVSNTQQQLALTVNGERVVIKR